MDRADVAAAASCGSDSPRVGAGKPCHPLHQIGKPVGGVRARQRTRGRSHGDEPLPGCRQAARSPPRAARRKSVLLDADRAAGRFQHLGIGESGPGRAHAAAAPGSPDGRWQRVRRPSRRRSGDTPDGCPPCGPGRSVKNGATLGLHAEPRVGRPRRAAMSSRAPAARRRGARSIVGGRASIAAGTMSAMMRAPWLPPNTSRRSVPPARRRRRSIARPRSRPAAPDCRCASPWRELGARGRARPGKLVAIARTRGASKRLARPITPFCS